MPRSEPESKRVGARAGLGLLGGLILAGCMEPGSCPPNPNRPEFYRAPLNGELAGCWVRTDHSMPVERVCFLDGTKVEYWDRNFPSEPREVQWGCLTWSLETPFNSVAVRDSGIHETWRAAGGNLVKEQSVEYASSKSYAVIDGVLTAFQSYTDPNLCYGTITINARYAKDDGFIQDPLLLHCDSLGFKTR